MNVSLHQIHGRNDALQQGHGRICFHVFIGIQHLYLIFNSFKKNPLLFETLVYDSTHNHLKNYKYLKN